MERTLLLTKAQNAEISRDFQTAARLYKELLNLEPDNLEYLSMKEHNEIHHKKEKEIQDNGGI